MPDNRVVKSKQIYDGHVVKLQVDTVELADGQIVEREIINHDGAVAMIALDDKEQVYLVRQYRAAAGLDLLEIPAGGIIPGETREDCARRELQEEIGYYPEKLIRLGDFHVAASYTSEVITIYLVEGMRPSQLEGDPDEEIEIEMMAFDQALRKALSGQFTDSKTIIGLTWAAHHLGRLK